MPSPAFQPLSPVQYLGRSRLVFGDRLAVIDGKRRYTYREFHDRAVRQAGALRGVGVERGDRVAVLCPNNRVLLEAHYGVPMAGAVLVAMNIRLSSAELAYILDHSGASFLMFDYRLREKALEAVAKASGPISAIETGGSGDEYERFLADAEPFAEEVADEYSLLAINYTSGTTGRPRGVMYHHRGAYLQALAMAFHTRMGPDAVHLWTLPMFHCNGWCFTWGVTAAGAVHLCLEKLDAGHVWRLIRDEDVTHFNAAPTVLTALASHPQADETLPLRPVTVGTGGAPPTPTLLARMADLNMNVIHLYGLTETFGPVGICEWRPEWDDLQIPEQARLKARQGVGNVISVPMRVVDHMGTEVPADGQTMGQVAIRGNNLMLGYYEDPTATDEAIPDGWFRTGDLAVMHPDGYLELRDRSKDIIISGGENIASIEVEHAVASHEAVLEVAVVASPDEKWGEVPVAYVTLKPGEKATPEDIIHHVRERIAHFKAPKSVVFADLPKTSTGKIQKYLIREWAQGSDGK